MKICKRRRKIKNNENQKTPPKRWNLRIFSLIVGLVLSISVIIININKIFKPKFGDLQITCNADSAQIYLNDEHKGFTLINRAITIESLKPGSYILKVRKSGFESKVYEDIEIYAGKTTSQYVELMQKVPIVKKFRITNFHDKGLNKLIEKEIGFLYDDKSNDVDFLISFKLTREIEQAGSSNLFRIRKSNLAIYVNGQLKKVTSEFKFPAFWARARPKKALEDTLRAMMHNQIIDKKSLIVRYIIDCIK